MAKSSAMPSVVHLLVSAGIAAGVVLVMVKAGYIAKGAK